MSCLIAIGLGLALWGGCAPSTVTGLDAPLQDVGRLPDTGAALADAGLDGSTDPSPDSGVPIPGLLAVGGAPMEALGTSVALSFDGSRALVGAPQHSRVGTPFVDAGHARVFLRTGTTWTLEAMLRGIGGEDGFGESVALSAAGDLALVGALTGGAQVFIRSGTTWTEEATLTGPGRSVALSADGTRAVLSGVVFVRIGATWTEEARLLGPSVASRAPVALDSDGSTALVAAPLDNMSSGLVHVSRRSTTTWADEATLVAGGGVLAFLFGTSVALSSDATRALVGVSRDDQADFAAGGSARVFLRSGATWSEEASLHRGGGENPSVGLSADGRRAVVGSPFAAPGSGSIVAGSARVFTLAGAAWAEDMVFVPEGGQPGDLFGLSVALSGDGRWLLVGAPGDDAGSGGDEGSVWAFPLPAP